MKTISILALCICTLFLCMSVSALPNYTTTFTIIDTYNNNTRVTTPLMVMASGFNGTAVYPSTQLVHNGIAYLATDLGNVTLTISGDQYFTTRQEFVIDGNNTYIVPIIPIIAYNPPTNLTALLSTNLTTTTIPYVHQGDTLYLGYTYDVSGIVPFPNQRFGWWANDDPCSSSPDILISVEGKAKYNLFIDAKTFRLGTWYKWGTDVCNPSENNIGFKVKLMSPYMATNITMVNGTPIITTANLTVQPTFLLPNKHIDDILVAHGDPLNYNISWYNTSLNQSSIWVFGTLDGIYDIRVNGTAFTLTKNQIYSLQDGKYTVVFEDAGYNHMIEAIWNEPAYSVQSPLRKVPDLNVIDIKYKKGAPVGSIFYQRFLDWVHQYSDDILTTVSMTVQEPYFDVVRADEVPTSSGNMSYIDVRGYTNLAEGTPVYCIWDEELQTARSMQFYNHTTTAISYGAGDMRQFQTIIPLDYNFTYIGLHWITCHAPLNLNQKLEWHIYQTTSSTYQPPASNKYSGGNLFVPTPTPIVRTVEKIVTQVTIKEVIKEVGPSDAQVLAQQKIATEANTNMWIARSVVGLVVVVGVLYATRIYLKGRKKRKQRDL